MVDFHSHILPSLDDGSKSTEESLALLKMLSDQGIAVVCATPHFNADRATVGEFLKKRSASYERLSAALPEDAPKIMLGAEVAYYEGISRLEDLNGLCIEGTKILLLELPFAAWSEYTVSEVIRLSCRGDLRIALAHVERYMSFNRAEVFERFRENGILLQTNASFFTSLRTRRKAIRMLKNGYIQLIGSDCHNVTERPPMIGNALNLIEKKLGSQFVSDMARYWHSLFSKIHAK